MKTASSTRPVRLFISYSHKDVAHKDKLWKQLYRPMGGKGEMWHDLMIEPGQAWHKEIWVALHQADLVLFLMSDDALDSDFIWNQEITTTLEKHRKKEVEFIPIYLRRCNWMEISDLKKLQALPRDNKPMIDANLWGSDDEPFEKVAGEIIEKVKTIWQRINNEIIVQNRPLRFAGIAQFLTENPQFFEMGKIVKQPGQPEDVLYFIGIAGHLKDLSDKIRRADENGTGWVEETLKEIDFFFDICDQMETVFGCSDYVWEKIRAIHKETRESMILVQKEVIKYIGASWEKLDYYKSSVALPVSYTLDEYQHLLKELAEESLSSQ